MITPSVLTCEEKLFPAVAQNRRLYELRTGAETAIAQTVARLALASGCNVVALEPAGSQIARRIQPLGCKTFTVCASFNGDTTPDGISFAGVDESCANRLRRRCRESVGAKYILCCIGIAERIDLELLPEFLFSLNRLAGTEIFLGIQCRSTSVCSKFRASLLPVATWSKLLSLAGLEITSRCDLDVHAAKGNATDSRVERVWLQRDLFREGRVWPDVFVRLRRRCGQITLSALKDDVADIVDTGYRSRKRRMVLPSDLPPLRYHVNFIQDWSYARSLMDVWPADRFAVTLRSDNISRPYVSVVNALLERTAVVSHQCESVADSASALASFGGIAESLVVTATEGLPFLGHLMGSLTLLAARTLGARTVSLQHGMTVFRNFTSAAHVFGVWDESTALQVSAENKAVATFDVKSIGSVKFLDAMLPQHRDALRWRLGAWVDGYRAKILVGLNLHWDVHTASPAATYSWLKRVARNNPDILFILRPHPDDPTVYQRLADGIGLNVCILDEICLLSLDWPVSRLIRAVDGVITSYSTLAVDAAAAGTPVLVLPFERGKTSSASHYYPPSSPWATASVPVLGENFIRAGQLPETFIEPAADKGEPPRDFFQASTNALNNLAACGTGPQQPDGGLGMATKRIVDMAISVLQHNSMAEHCNRQLENVTSAIDRAAN